MVEAQILVVETKGVDKGTLMVGMVEIQTLVAVMRLTVEVVKVRVAEG